MRALFDLICQAIIGLLVCTSLAFGMAYVTGQNVMGQTSSSEGSKDGSQLAVGACRKCSNPIRFNRDEWCAVCPRCQTLTNTDQVPRRHRAD